MGIPAVAVEEAPPPPPRVALTAPPPPPPRHVTRWTRSVGITLAAVGLAAVGTGLYFGAHSSALSASARTEPKVGTALALGTQARHSAQTANTFYAAGGGVAAVGATLLVLSF